MIFLTKEDVLKNIAFYVDEVRKGKVFIYPTDTLFGLGVDATHKDGVQRIFAIKKREKKPLLIITPSFQWIEDHCIITSANHLILKEKLPGPYAFVMNLKDKSVINEMVNAGQDSIGVRIPDCWFTDVVRQASVPFVTTSVNFSGQVAAKKISDIPQVILDQVDYVIDDDEPLSGKASTIIDIRGEKKVVRA